jgi:hypothetical protein
MAGLDPAIHVVVAENLRASVFRPGKSAFSGVILSCHADVDGRVFARP